MLPDTFNRKAFDDINKLQDINKKLFDLNLKKKDISARIIEISKNENSDIRNFEVEKLFNDLSELERKIADLENEKSALVKNLREKLYDASSLLDNFEHFCSFNGIISVSGPPSSGKVGMIFRFLNYCTFRDHIIVVFRDYERIERMVKNSGMDIEILAVNPVYAEKKLDIKSVDQISKIANRLANDILKIVKDKKDPIIVIHRSNDLSLDRINEISNLLKEEFWKNFINFISPVKNRFLLIFNCDELGEECTNLLTFSDFLVKVSLKDDERKFYITKLIL